MVAAAFFIGLEPTTNDVRPTTVLSLRHMRPMLEVVLNNFRGQGGADG